MTVGLISSVAADTGLSRGVLARVSASAAHRYKVYRIPKRQGGHRVVAQPAREVKAIQRAIVRFLAKSLPIHECATAYVPGSKLLENATPHVGRRFLLKLDFEAFFPSIDDSAVRWLLQYRLGDRISGPEVQFVLDSCLWRHPALPRRVLCIGAPSSPFLSNAVMHGIDSESFECSSTRGVVYTRYSDDVTFSSDLPERLTEVEGMFRAICARARHPRLTFNERKRVFVSRGSAMRVTGLTLTNQGGVSVGRSRKRGVRAGLNEFVQGVLDAERIEKLRGELAFVLSIEPAFRDVLLRTYGAEVLRLMPANSG